MRYLATLVLVVSAMSLGSCDPEPVGATLPHADNGVALEVEHTPVELVVVLDTSMSMTHRQMDLARSLVENLILLLNDADRFSLVVLADEATIAIESSYATSPAKTQWLPRIRALEAGGLTNLEDALELTRTLTSAKTRVVLISDGSPTWGSVVAEELTRSAEGLDLWTVGVGRNNEALLRELGRYSYLQDPAELARTIITGTVTPDAKAARSLPPEHRGR